MISEEVKHRLMAEAKNRFGDDITPLRGEPFQVWHGKVIYWFDDNKGSTHIVSETTKEEES